MERPTHLVSLLGRPAWERKANELRAARRAARRSKNRGVIALMTGWLVVWTDGCCKTCWCGGSAPHRRLLRRRPPRAAENGERRNDLQEAPPAWPLCGQNEKRPSLGLVAAVASGWPGGRDRVGWRGCGFLLQPCRTGRLGVSGVSGGL